jgi:serpin B
MHSAPCRRRVPYIGTALALAALLASPQGVGAQDASGQQAAQSSAALGVDLYHIFAKSDGNVLFSPYSISTALALLSAGADGNTRSELLGALHWGDSAASPADVFGALDRHLDDAARGNETLLVANGLWCQQDEALLPAFLKTAQTDLGAEVQSVDFVRNAPAVEKEINDWVAQKTSGKINDLIAPGVLTASTRLALVNAVYFKGDWEHPFRASSTSPRPFQIGPNQSVPVATMVETEELKMASVPGCDLLELPYEGGALSMVVLLPRAPADVHSLEQGLTTAGLFGWLSTLDFSKQQEVNVKLPKFSMTYAVDLTPVLGQIGLKTALAPGEADFSLLNGKRDLCVSAAQHKAYVDVSEEGTEAAAATGMVMVMLSVRPSSEFNVDHPFIFLIRDNATGCLLFLGRVVDPRAQ